MCLWVLVDAWDVGACLRCALARVTRLPHLRVICASWTGCDVEECVFWGVRAVCDGVE